MRKKVVLLAVSALVLATITPFANAAVKPGTKCSKQGQTSTAAGMKYTCIKSGKNLVWGKGVAVKKTLPAPTPETKVEVKNLLASDSRITPTSALTALSICKTEDKTPDYLADGVLRHRNGFPRPPEAITGKKSAKILVIPIGFKDIPFYTDKIQRGQAFTSDLDLLNDTVPLVKDAFKKISGGRFEITIDVLPKSEFWLLDIDNPLSGVWGTDNISRILEIISKYKSDFKFGDYDSFVFVTGNGTQGSQGLGTAQGDVGLKVKNSKTGTISMMYMAGGLQNTALWVHELGHSFFALEDLYLFSEVNTGPTSSTRDTDLDIPLRWDVMASSNRGLGLLEWNRLLMGWISDSEVRCLSDQKSSIHYVSDVDTTTDPKLLTMNLSPGVTLAAEARQGSGTDKGLLLYLVNTYSNAGEGVILTQKSVLAKGQSKSMLGWQFSVIDTNADGVLFEATKTDIDKFVPPPPKPQSNPGQPTSPIRVSRGEVVPDGFLKARATWEVTGHESYRLYVTDPVDFQKVYFETGYVNDSRNPIVVNITGLVCNKEFRTMLEFYTEKNGKGERLNMQSLQLRNLSCEDTTKKP